MKCPLISRTVVSTDSPEIADITRKYSADVPFLRPAALAGDETPSVDVVLHCLEFLENAENYRPDFVCLLQCTSPLRNERHISEAIELLAVHKAKSVVSVCKSGKSPYWAKTINGDGFLEDLIEQSSDVTRRQELPDTYDLNGAIYINETRLVYDTKKLVSEASRPYVMDKLHSFDIDDAFDFILAEAVIRRASKTKEA